MNIFGKNRILQAFVLCVCAVAGCAFLPTRDDSKDSESQETITRPFVVTMVLNSETESRVERTFTGTVSAPQTSELGFKQIGTVESVAVDNGDRIQAGQVLATLNSDSLMAQKGVLKSKRDSATALMDELIAGPRKQTIDAAKAQLKEAQAMRDQTQLAWQRNASLRGTNAISHQAIDDARHQLVAAEARLTGRREMLSELQEGTRKEQLAAQRAQIAQLDAALQQLQVQLNENKIVAPYDGVVARRFVDPGTVAQPGIPMLRVMNITPLEVWVGLPPDMIDELKIGQPYTFVTSRGKKSGILASVLSELDMQTRTQTAIFELPVATSAVPLAVGQIVQLELSQTIPTEGFWVPLHALVRGSKGLWSVFVAVDDGGANKYKIRRSDVEVLRAESSRVLITGAINDGDQIIESGVQKLTSGQRVQVSSPESENITTTPRPDEPPGVSPAAY